MNRRELFAVAGTMLIPNFGEKWELIDKRLSGKIDITSLQDGEGGYIYVPGLHKAKDGLYYFVNQYQYMVYDNQADTIKSCPWLASSVNLEKYTSLIYAYGDYYYINIKSQYETVLTEPGCLAYTKSYPYETVLTEPGCLAYTKSYPLDNKVGDFYKVPRKWQDCAKHPLVQKNIEELKKGIKIANSLKEMQLQCLLSCNDVHLKSVLDV